ncbi:hypothetical protein CC79DRAFT_1363695 [Sarocladium strictum]
MNTPGPAPVEKHISGDHVLKTPIWIVVIRVFQFLISLIVVGLAGSLMHDAYLDEHGLAVATSIITWVIVIYILVTEKVRSCHQAYHIIAVMVLDGFMVILWLATFAAVAAKRAQFVVDVSVSNCYDDGSLLDSKTCFKKRAVILFKSGQAMMSAEAGLGALVWVLFVVTFVWTIVQFVRGRKEGRFPISSGTSTTKPTAATVEGYQMEPKPVDPNQQQQQQAQYPVQHQTGMMQNQVPQGQYPQQGHYPQEQYPQGQYPQGQYPQQAVSPNSAQGPYSPPAPGYPQDQQMYNQYPQHQPYPQQQQQYQPPSSPSPITHTSESVTMPSQSPPPQELAPQPYPVAPQEMPSTNYQAPPHHQQHQ